MARIRYSTVIIGSTLAGLAGATLLIETGIFEENITQSAGFIAVALVYFGAWRPAGVMAGALLYGLTEAVILAWKGLGIIPVSLSDLAATAPARTDRARAADGRTPLPAAGRARQALRTRRLTAPRTALRAFLGASGQKTPIAAQDTR